MKIEFPGLFDLQVNGFSGVDFNTPGCSAEQLLKATESIQQTGVTRFLPTLITSSLESFSACAKGLARLANPAIAGIHMEGPYISPEDGARGAHPRKYVTGASVEDFERRQEAAEGRIVLVTLAPEVPGALGLIEFLVASGVRVAIGHTDASPAQIADAVHAGASLSTHLGNGCSQVLARHPNVIWEQLAADELMASLIVDGHHLPPATVKSMIRAKAVSRSILITDATAAAGSVRGVFSLGETQIELSDGGRVIQGGALKAPGNLAGSALSLSTAVANVVKFAGVTLDEAVAMASIRPARYIGSETAGRVCAEWDSEECRLSVVSVTL